MNDGWTIAQWVFNGLITIILAYIARKNHQIDRLQSKIEERAEKYLQDRFFAIGREMTGHLEPVLKSIDEISARLKEGERAFSGLSERDHQVELKMMNMVSGLKDSIHECYATRQDFAGLQQAVEKLTDRFSALQQAVARAIHEGGRHG